MIKDYISFKGNSGKLALTQSASKRCDDEFYQMKMLGWYIEDKVFADKISKKIIQKEILNIKDFFNLIESK